MGAIVDMLLLAERDIHVLMSEYPCCVLTNKTNSAQSVQQYMLIIPDKDQYDDNYYYFLFDNNIATSSRNFQSRFENDELFRERIRARADAKRIDPEGHNR
jgi:hypothetical protein